MNLCQNCDGNNDVVAFKRGKEQVVLCTDCRFKLLSGAPRVTGRLPGRPSLGTTKKVSLTLPDETWEWIDEQAGENRSALIRYLIGRERSPEREWSNNTCLGYAIFGAQKLGYDEEQTKELIRAIYSQFDMKTVEEARTAYSNSPY
jgi:hypothetical protein